MIYGLILSDNWNQFGEHRDGIRRNPAGHILSNFLGDHGIKSDVIDFWHDFTVQELSDIFAQRKPTFIAITATLDKKYHQWERLLPMIKDSCPDTKIIVYGERSLRLGYHGVDYHIEGFAETAILSLLRDGVLIHKEIHGQKLVDANKDYPNDLQAKGFSGMMKPYDFVDANETYVMTFSRGCIFTCAFCNHSAIGVKKSLWSRQDAEIKKEFIEAYQLGIRKFIITDSTFNDGNEKISLLEEIVGQFDEPISIVCFLRLDILYQQNTVLDRLVRSGVRAIHFGIDTFHAEAGRRVGKHIDPEILKNYLIDIRGKYPDLFIYGTFIVGLPGETERDCRETYRWLVENPVLDLWHWFPLSIKVDQGHAEILSPIERNHEKYGYQNLGHDKIDDLGRGYRDKNLSVISWRNEHIDLDQAKSLAHELNNQARGYTKSINPWVLFNRSVVCKDLDYWLRVPARELSGSVVEDLKTSTSEFITRYKKKKIDYFNGAIPCKVAVSDR